MTEQEYKSKYGDSDDFAKHYRDEEKFKCMDCLKLFKKEEIFEGYCEDCSKNFIIDNIN